jgi:hypothetical protein
MSRLLIHEETGDDWQVWISLDDHDPLNDPFGFIIGTGKTRDAAVADAVRDLEAILEQLQAPPGTIEERSRT